MCKVLCNHCCAGKYMSSFCDTYLWTDLYFLSVFFISLCHQFYSDHQGFSNRDTIIGHVNMYLVKANSENN